MFVVETVAFVELAGLLFCVTSVMVGVKCFIIIIIYWMAQCSLCV